jgi:hypothetical protein
MSILQLIKCRVGRHQWNDWKYVPIFQFKITPTECVEERICVVCKKQETRIGTLPHQWSEWVLTKNKCIQTHKCQRCKKHEEREVEHTWNDLCDHIRVCSHCKQYDEKKAAHNWGDWSFYEEGCSETRNCKCGKAEKIARHTWENNDVYNCGNGNTRECKYCHALKVSSDFQHDWGEWVLYSEQCEKTRKCQYCGNLDRIPLSHTWGEWKVKDLTCLKERICQKCGAIDNTPDTNANENLHEYKFVESRDDEFRKIDGVVCEEIWTKVYACKNCGHVKTERESQWLLGGGFPE